MQENNKLRLNPFQFACNYVVNMTNMEPVAEFKPENQNQSHDLWKNNALKQLDAHKLGYFNFEKPSIFSSTRRMLGGIADPGGHTSDPLIRAYWVGYVPIGTQGAGIGNVPYVDVPTALPAQSFVFTGSMNGCSLVVTDSPLVGHIRIYHDSAHLPATFAGLNVRIRLDYDNQHNSPHMYGDQHPVGDVPTSWNFFYYNGAHWMMVSQPQVFIPGGQTPDVKFNPVKPPFEVQVP